MGYGLMKAAFADEAVEVDGPLWRPTIADRKASEPPCPESDTAGPEPTSQYGEGRRVSLPAVLAIVAAHLLLLWALVTLDVVQIGPRRAEPTIVELIPEPIAPPPAPREQPRPEVEQAKPEVVAPPPVVTVPAPAPSPVAATETPPPPVPVAVAPPVVAAPAVEGPPLAEPVVAPRPLGTAAGNAPPEYPMEARRLRWSGTVRLRVVISTDGRVKEIGVATSSGHDVLDKAALKAVQKWKFQPAMRGGQPVEGIGYVPIPFVLKG